MGLFDHKLDDLKGWPPPTKLAYDLAQAAPDPVKVKGGGSGAPDGSIIQFRHALVDGMTVTNLRVYARGDRIEAATFLMPGGMTRTIPGRRIAEFFVAAIDAEIRTRDLDGPFASISSVQHAELEGNLAAALAKFSGPGPGNPGPPLVSPIWSTSSSTPAADIVALKAQLDAIQPLPYPEPLPVDVSFEALPANYMPAVGDVIQAADGPRRIVQVDAVKGTITTIPSGKGFEFKPIPMGTPYKLTEGVYGSFLEGWPDDIEPASFTKAALKDTQDNVFQTMMGIPSHLLGPSSGILGDLGPASPVDPASFAASPPQPTPLPPLGRQVCVRGLDLDD